jgi:hypothetical protein
MLLYCGLFVGGRPSVENLDLLIAKSESLSEPTSLRTGIAAIVDENPKYSHSSVMFDYGGEQLQAEVAAGSVLRRDIGLREAKLSRSEVVCGVSRFDPREFLEQPAQRPGRDRVRGDASLALSVRLGRHVGDKGSIEQGIRHVQYE